MIRAIEIWRTRRNTALCTGTYRVSMPTDLLAQVSQQQICWYCAGVAPPGGGKTHHPARLLVQ